MKINLQKLKASFCILKNISTYSLALLVLTVSVQASEVWTGNQIDGGSPFEESCELNPISATSDAHGSPATTEGGVFLERGSAVFSENDVSLPGVTFPWSHTRTYDSELEAASQYDTYRSPNGKRWHGGLSQTYILQDSNDLVLYLDASTKRTFTESSGTYSAPSDMHATLVKTGSGNTEEYVVTDTNTGKILVFYGHSVTNSHEQGKLKRLSNIYFEEQGEDGTTFSWSNDETLDFVTTSQGWYINYDYIASGSLAGKLDKIEIYDVDKDTVDYYGGTPIKKVEYDYYGEAGGESTDVGTTGDLILVEYSTLMHDSTYEVRYTQYRYFSDHRLKAVYSSGAIERLIADNSNVSTASYILTLGDSFSTGSASSSSVEDFATKTFTYYTSSTLIDTDDIDHTDSLWISTGKEDMGNDLGGTNIDETDKVKTVLSNGSCGSCGGSSSNGVKRTYFYMGNTSNSNDEPDQIIVEDTSYYDTADVGVLRQIHGINPNGRTVRHSLIEGYSPGMTTTFTNAWAMAVTFDGSDRLEEKRNPSAYDITTIGQLKSFIDNGDGQLQTDEGLIYIYSYNSDDRLTDIKVKRGSNGDDHFIQSMEYYDGTGDDPPSQFVEWTYSYPDKTQTRIDPGSNPTTDGKKVTEFTYTFWDTSNKTQIKKLTTELPEIPTLENGSGIKTESLQYFDNRGRLRWTKDGEERVNYYSYHPDLGVLTYTVKDVDSDGLDSTMTNISETRWLPWTTGELTGFESNGNEVELITQVEIDTQGRQEKLIDPGGFEHFTVLHPDTRMHFPYWNDAAAAKKSERPISVTETNADGRPLATLTMEGNAASASTSSPYVPTGLTNINDFSKTLTLTEYDYGEVSGQLVNTHRYHNIPSTGTRGSTTTDLGNDYYKTVLLYDEMGRTEYTVQLVSGISSSTAVEQITQSVYDKLSRVIETKKAISSSSNDLGTNFNTFTGVTFKTVSKTEYDENGVGDGYVTKTMNYYDADNNGYYIGLNYKYTFRGHRRGVEPVYKTDSSESDYGPYTVLDLDWSGKVTAQALFHSQPNWSTILSNEGYDEAAQSTTQSARRTLSTTSYDYLGRAYENRRYKIDSSNGNKGNFFQYFNYFDRNSRLVATSQTKGISQEIAYDGVGRQYQQRIVKKLEDTKYNGTSGEFQYQYPLPDPSFSVLDALMSNAGDDNVLTINHSEYSKTGNTLLTHNLEAKHDDTNGIDLDDDDDYVRTTTYSWFDDDSDYQEVSAFYGTGGTNFSYYGVPTKPSTAPTSSSSDRLRTGYTYSNGNLESIIDPKGNKTKFTYDNLGRLVKEQKIEVVPMVGETDLVHLLTEYDGLSNVIKRINDAGMDNTLADGVWSEVGVYDDQTTTYLFEDSYIASFQTEIKPPDHSTGSHTQEFTYYLDGLIKTKTDQNGSTITYNYSDERQLINQKATTIGSGIDDSIEAIKYEYDTELKRLESVTSYSDTSLSTDENGIFFEYNDLGQLEYSYQHHEDKITTMNKGSTNKVQYHYDSLANFDSVFEDNHRLYKITYPSGKEITYDYDSAESISDLLSRVKKIEDESSDLVEYEFMGVGSKIVTASYPTPKVKLMYNKNSDYEGYDRFGRIVNQLWEADPMVPYAVDKFEYEYDYSSNPTVREMPLGSSPQDKSQTYTYDALNRLTAYTQGQYNGTSIPTMDDTRIVNWTLDTLGNWTEYKIDENADDDFTDATDLDQDRDSNIANEIDTDDDHSNAPGANAFQEGMSQSAWVSPYYDANGNLEGGPRPGTETSKDWYVYDAWNRLVKVWQDGGNGTRDLDDMGSDDTLIVEYEYDGLNRRIIKNNDVDSEVHHFYYSRSWQILEVREEDMGSEISNPVDVNVWHTYYIDALAVRYYDSDTMDQTSKKLYHTHDTNFNVTAILEDDADVLERYEYTPYGEVTILEAGWADDGDQVSDYANEILFTGQRIDREVGIYHYRNREYLANLGKFLQRDPTGSWEDQKSLGNSYAYTGNSPIIQNDPFGTTTSGGYNCDPFLSLCGPDVTDYLVDLIKNAFNSQTFKDLIDPAKEMQEGISSLPGKNILDGIQNVDAALKFAHAFRKNGPWDPKSKVYKSFNCPTRNCKGLVTMCDQYCVKKDTMGNILFGAILNQLGFNLQQTQSAATAAALASFQLGEDKDDKCAIELGWNAADTAKADPNATPPVTLSGALKGKICAALPLYLKCLQSDTTPKFRNQFDNCYPCKEKYRPTHYR